MLIKPTTCNSFASKMLCFFNLSIISLSKEYGGIQHALSPEWMPASSICCINPTMVTFIPSEIASTSISIALLIKLSINIGFLPLTFTA